MPLKISGEFQLSKRSPADRISGSISIQLNVVLGPSASKPANNVSIDRGLTTPSPNKPRASYHLVGSNGKADPNTHVTSGGDSTGSSKGSTSGEQNRNKLDGEEYTYSYLENIIHTGNEEVLDVIPKPVISNKLSQRIGQLKKKTLDTAPPRPLQPSTAASPTPSIDPHQEVKEVCRSSTMAKERKALYVNRSGGKSFEANSKLAAVTRQLDGLGTALQVRFYA